MGFVKSLVTGEPNTMGSGPLARTLWDQINGNGPNLAQQQFQNNAQGLQRQTASTIGGLKGINPSLAAKTVLDRQAQIGQDVIGQSALARMQQQLEAQRQLAGIQSQAASENARFQGQLIGGAMNGAGAMLGMAHGGEVASANGPTSALGRLLMTAGGEVPGRAAEAGDAAENDRVPAMLSPGEIVIPRSHAESPEDARDFVASLMARKGRAKSYKDVAKWRGGKVGC